MDEGVRAASDPHVIGCMPVVGPPVSVKVDRLTEHVDGSKHGGEHEPQPETGCKFYRICRCTNTRPNRRPRNLQRPWIDGQLRDARPVNTFPGNGFLRPHPKQQFQVLSKHLLGQTGVLPERAERVREKGATPNNGLHPATRNHVERGVVLGQAKWVQIDPEGNSGRQPEVSGALRNSSQHHRRSAQDVVAKVVLTQMDAVETHRFCQHRLINQVAVAASVRAPLPRHWIGDQVT
jgi:hypothetical protein